MLRPSRENRAKGTRALQGYAQQSAAYCDSLQLLRHALRMKPIDACAAIRERAAGALAEAGSQLSFLFANAPFSQDVAQAVSLFS
jgi:hypothetical protein